MRYILQVLVLFGAFVFHKLLKYFLLLQSSSAFEGFCVTWNAVFTGASARRVTMGTGKERSWTCLCNA